MVRTSERRWVNPNSRLDRKAQSSWPFQKGHATGFRHDIGKQLKDTEELVLNDAGREKWTYIRPVKRI